MSHVSRALTLAIRAAPPVALFGGLYLAMSLITDQAAWQTDPTDPTDVVMHRESQRSMFAAIVNGVTTSVVAFLLVHMGAKAPRVGVFFSMFFAAVTGFAIDRVLIPDAGVDSIKQGGWVDRLLRRIGSWGFVRYCVAIFLDIAVLEPLIEMVLKSGTMAEVESILLAGPAYDQFVGKNLYSIATAIFSVLSFNAFSQSTKLLWAYVDNSTPKSDRLPGNMMALAIAVASIVTIQRRPVMTIAGVAGMATLTRTGHLDETPAEGEGDASIGLVLGAMSAGVGLALPFI